jgi:putative SOS response-associated peptidase YedK
MSDGNRAREGRAVRSGETIIERPDGTRRWFAPYPTPLRDGEGLVNACADTVADKLAFRSAFQGRRCLVPADGFCDGGLLLWSPNQKLMVKAEPHRRLNSQNKSLGGITTIPNYGNSVFPRTVFD